MPVLQLPRGHQVVPERRSLSAQTRPAHIPEQNRVQALAQGPLQEERPVRVLARVQFAEDARVRLLHKKRLLHAIAGVPVPPRRPQVPGGGVPGLQHGFLPAGSAVHQETHQEGVLSSIHGRVLPSGRGLRLVAPQVHGAVRA